MQQTEEDLNRRSFFVELLKKCGIALTGFITARIGLASLVKQKGKESGSKNEAEVQERKVNLDGEDNSVVLPVKSSKSKDMS